MQLDAEIAYKSLPKQKITPEQLFSEEKREGIKELISNVYTEEEMRDIVHKTVDKFCPYFFPEMKLQVAEEWFNQIKK